MITYPNQKVIQVKSMPHNGKDKSQPYGCINIEASNRAARVLKPNAYRMYIRIVLNQDGHEFALSPKAMREEIGISPTGYETAVKNLIDAGYLVQIRNGSNKYIFYENPPEKVATTVPVYCPPIATKTMMDIPQKREDLSSKMGEKVPSFSEEIIQDIKNNIDNREDHSYPSRKRELSYNERLEQKILNSLKEIEGREQRRIQGIQSEFQHNYRRAMRKLIDYDTLSSVKYDLIIKKYLADHPESEFLHQAGDKFGRWIHGWNEEKQEPIIAYAFNYLEPEQMKQNIEAIPKSYYLHKKPSLTTKTSQ